MTMPVVNPGEFWMIDFGMTAKVRPALLLTGTPADDELDIVTALLHTTALRGNHWELSIPQPFLKPGALHLQQLHTISTVKLARKLGMLRAEDTKGTPARLGRLAKSKQRWRCSGNRIHTSIPQNQRFRAGLTG